MADRKAPKKNERHGATVWLAGIGAYGKAFEEKRARIRVFSGTIGGTNPRTSSKSSPKGREKLETGR